MGAAVALRAKGAYSAVARVGAPRWLLASRESVSRRMPYKCSDRWNKRKPCGPAAAAVRLPDPSATVSVSVTLRRWRSRRRIFLDSLIVSVCRPAAAKPFVAFAVFLATLRLAVAVAASSVVNESRSFERTVSDLASVRATFGGVVSVAGGGGEGCAAPTPCTVMTIVFVADSGPTLSALVSVA